MSEVKAGDLDEIVAVASLVIENTKLKERVLQLEQALMRVACLTHTEHHRGGIDDCIELSCSLSSRVMGKISENVIEPIVLDWLKANVEPAWSMEVADGVGLLTMDVERALRSLEAKRSIRRANDGKRWIFGSPDAGDCVHL